MYPVDCKVRFIAAGDITAARIQAGDRLKIILFEDKYRDDMIFMILEAKNAPGRVPRLNADLPDIRANYFDKGDMFRIAVDENDRVAGSVGYSSIEGTAEVRLHRLFVKYDLKRRGIGTQLLQTAENHAKQCSKTAVHVHLGAPREQWAESYSFYPKNGYVEYEERYMKKQL